MNTIKIERVGEVFILTQENHGKEDRLYFTVEQAYKILVGLTKELHGVYDDAK